MVSNLDKLLSTKKHVTLADLKSVGFITARDIAVLKEYLNESVTIIIASPEILPAHLFLNAICERKFVKTISLREANRRDEFLLTRLEDNLFEYIDDDDVNMKFRNKVKVRIDEIRDLEDAVVAIDLWGRGWNIVTAMCTKNSWANKFVEFFNQNLHEHVLNVMHYVDTLELKIIKDKGNFRVARIF